MNHRFNSAIGVPVARVGILAVALVMLPSFTLLARNDSAAPAVEITSTAHAESTATAITSASASAAATTAYVLSGWEDATLGGIDPKVFELALGAARCAVRSGAVRAPRTLTIIDYSKPSTSRRLWVYDVNKRALLYEELVAHGRGSGENFATRFSNVPDSHRTSLGLFVTDETYVGRNGYSLRMNGLDKGFNDRARQRAIVMHGASYVSDTFAKAQGRIGRSHGCPALDDGIARRVIDTVKGGGLVFSYYPDRNWLTSSPFLKGCA